MCYGLHKMEMGRHQGLMDLVLLSGCGRGSNVRSRQQVFQIVSRVRSGTCRPDRIEV